MLTYLFIHLVILQIFLSTYHFKDTNISLRGVGYCGKVCKICIMPLTPVFEYVTNMRMKGKRGIGHSCWEKFTGLLHGAWDRSVCLEQCVERMPQGEEFRVSGVRL